MDTLTIGILAPVITFLIGRYYIKRKPQILRDTEAARDYWKSESENLKYLEEQYLEIISSSPKFELVANKDKHPSANDNYLYIEGEINGKREAGLFTLNDWSKAKERLLKNPEDKPL